MEINYNNSFFLPRQRIPDSEKDDDWKINNTRSIMGMAVSNSQGQWRSNKQQKQVNYNLFNGEFDEGDFEYVTDPMGLGNKFGGMPAKIEGFNITKSKIELLKGEEGARPFNWMVRGVGGQVMTIRTEEQRKMVVQYLQSQLLQKMGLNPGTEGDDVQTPEQIQKYMKSDFMDSREVTANQVLNFIVKRDHIQRKFNEGWEHSLLVAEEYYHIGIKDGHPSVRVVNPIGFEYDKDSDVKFIEDAEWVREERWLHPTTILDLYDELLTEEEIELIESGQVWNSINYGMQAGFAYQEGASPDGRFGSSDYNNGILVSHVAWRSWKQTWFLTDYDEETGQVLTQIIPKSIKLSAEQKARGAKVESKYRQEIWVGTAIGNDIFVDIRPADVQDGKLPYVGYIYNATNSKSTSLMDLMKPHQYTYMIVWWKLMGELAKSKGKKMPMDLAMLPKSWGMDLEQWIYYFDRLDVAWYNSMEENDKHQRTTPMQFSNVDMSMSQVVPQYIAILEKLEQQVAQLTGVSPQREAQTMASESATGTNTAVVQSSYITEPLFRYHNEVKKQVLTKVLNVAKIAYKDGKKIQYIVDEAYVANLEIDGDEFNDSDYGLFVSDSSRDYQTKQKLESLAQVALQQDKATLRDMVKLYNAQSMAEFEHYLIEAEDRKIQENQEMQKQEMASNERIAQQNQQTEAMKQDREDGRVDRKNTTAIKIAELNLSIKDQDKNGIPDNQEQGKVAVAQMKVMSDQTIKQQQLAQDEEKNKGDLLLKADDNRIKEKKVDADIKGDREERAHEKIMHEKEEQMMLKEDKLKDKDFNRTIKLDEHKVKHEEKIGAAKVKTAEKALTVKGKELTMKMKANADKVKTAKAMPKPSTKPKPKSK
jgi:hypothetical protein